MTREAALLKCIDMWTRISRLSEFGDRHEDVKYEVVCGMGEERPLYDCFTCEFAEGICEKCPINEWAMAAKQSGFPPCTHSSSPYRKFADAVNNGEGSPAKYAKKVAKLAFRSLINDT